MAVLPTDLRWYTSLDTNSLGGGISTTLVSTGLNGFFDDVDYNEALAGSTAYRCMYIKNESGTDTYTTPEIYIATMTPSPSTYCELGLGSSGLNGTEQSITSEEIAPVGVTFSSPSASLPLALGSDLGPGEYFPIWVKRVVEAEAAGASNDYVVIGLTGDGG